MTEIKKATKGTTRTGTWNLLSTLLWLFVKVKL